MIELATHVYLHPVTASQGKEKRHQTDDVMPKLLSPSAICECLQLFINHGKQKSTIHDQFYCTF